jgi:hypothetical protein
LDSCKKQSEKDKLKSKLEDINKRWTLLRKKSLEIRSRLESNSAQWSALLNSLKELIQWCHSQQQYINLRKQSLQPDINDINKQINENKVFMCNVEYKKPIIESTLASAKLYYDDRHRRKKVAREIVENNRKNTKETNENATIKKKLSNKKKQRQEKDRNSANLKINEFSEDDDGEEDSFSSETLADDFATSDDDNEADETTFDPSDSTLTPEEIANNFVKKIEKKVHQLTSLWSELTKQSVIYNSILVSFAQNLEQIHKSFDVVSQVINDNEKLVNEQCTNDMNSVEGDKLAEELEIVRQLQLRVSSYQPLVDEMCSQYSSINNELKQCGSFNIKNNNRIMNNPVTVSFNSKFDDLNLRWTNLQSLLQEKYLTLYSLIESSGANIFFKLNESVQSPWERGISPNNKVPYYIK